MSKQTTIELTLAFKPDPERWNRGLDALCKLLEKQLHHESNKQENPSATADDKRFSPISPNAPDGAV